MMFLVGVSVFLAFGISWLLLEPLFALPEREASLELGVQEDAERERAFRALEDLELDHRAGKISDEAYRQAKEELMQHLAKYIAA